MNNPEPIVTETMTRCIQNTTPPKEGDLSIWWIPQVPMRAFRWPVPDVQTGLLILTALGKYDLFCLANRVRPDYANAGGLDIFEDGEWVTWYSEEDGEDADFYLKEICEN